MFLDIFRRMTNMDADVEDAEHTTTPLPVTPELAHKDLVKMQRLAKKRRVFLIQKVTKRIKLLKNKKGNDAQLSKNQRKVERLLQRINDMKVLDLKDVVSEMVEQNFKISDSNLEQTKNWFMYELTQDKSSFMYFVNSLNESGKSETDIIKANDSSPSERSPKKRKLEKDEVFLNKLSSYSEKDDEVLNDIIKVKKNRPGQRARQKQWEELYGTQAKHLSKDKRSKQSNKRDLAKGKKRAADEVPPQEIIRRLKEKEKQKVPEKKEHPSWLAKRQQSSLSSKIDAFAGKKTTFSDDDD